MFHVYKPTKISMKQILAISNNLTKLSVNHFNTDGDPAKSSKKFEKYFRTLELEPGSSQDLVRRQYIQLVKKFHPDSAKSDSEKESHLLKFHKIDEAYRELQKKFISDRKREEESVGEYGLYYDAMKDEMVEVEDDENNRHTAPQHRQYLSNEGYGYGTPAQRQKQYQRMRATRAVDNLYDHRVSKLGSSYEDRLVESQRKAVKRQRAQNAIERLVEDLIVESMAKGEFDNLKGAGQPLPERVIYNPYEDFTTQKINQILAESGFAPEWITLKRDIENSKENIRDSIRDECRVVYSRQVLSHRERERWNVFVKKMEDESVKKLNASIDRFNLMVPLLYSQMVHFNFDKEVETITKTKVFMNRRLARLSFGLVEFQ